MFHVALAVFYMFRNSIFSCMMTCKSLWFWRPLWRFRIGMWWTKVESEHRCSAALASRMFWKEWGGTVVWLLEDKLSSDVGIHCGPWNSTELCCMFGKRQRLQGRSRIGSFRCQTFHFISSFGTSPCSPTFQSFPRIESCVFLSKTFLSTIKVKNV